MLVDLLGQSGEPFVERGLDLLLGRLRPFGIAGALVVECLQNFIHFFRIIRTRGFLACDPVGHQIGRMIRIDRRGT